jgi:hypothetical protein
MCESFSRLQKVASGCGLLLANGICQQICFATELALVALVYFRLRFLSILPLGRELSSKYGHSERLMDGLRSWQSRYVIPFRRDCLILPINSLSSSSIK